MRVSRAAAVVMALGLTLAACGGGGGEEPRPTATADTFNREGLRAIALQPEDVAPLEQQSAGLSSGEPPAFSASYSDGTVLVVSTVQRIVDPVDRDQVLFSTRSTFDQQITGERNLAVEGADQAFAYADMDDRGPRVGAIITKGYIIAYFTMSASTEDARERVHDPATLDAWAAATVARISDEAAGAPPGR